MTKKSLGDLEKGAKKACYLDPDYPTPMITTTLAKVSALAKVDFELLDSKERQTFLADVEHLLLADLPTDELRPDTRASFAASMIARLAPENRTSAAEIVRLKTLMNSLRKDLNGIVGEGEEPKTMKENIRTELAITEIFLDESIVSKQEEDKTLMEKYLFLLLKSLSEYPDRITLWQRILDYCQKTGLELDVIEDEFDKFSENNPFSSYYLYAFILQHLARQILSCTMTVLRANEVTTDKVECARAYLLSIERCGLHNKMEGSNFFFVISARKALQVSQAASKLVLSFDKLLLDQDQGSPIDQTTSAANAKNTPQIASNLLSALEDNEASAAWLWWLESSLRGFSNRPSQLWPIFGGLFDLNEEEAWSALSVYPQLYPKLAISEYLSGRRRLRLGEQGWFVDALKSSVAGSESVARISKGNTIGSGNLKRVLRVVQSARHVPTLFEWASWSSERAIVCPADPRVGEWTAVEIALRVCREIQSVKNRKRRLERFVQPQNILLAPEWMMAKIEGQSFEILTWEEWRTFLRGDGIRFRPRDWVQDSRYFRQVDQSDPSWEVLHSFGILLLGLLRRDFVWTAPVGSLARSPQWVMLVRNTVRSTKCSSWTRAIIDACLLPRFRETFLLDLLQPIVEFERENDTVSDDIQINSLDDLENSLSQSSRVLSKGQLTVRDHEPRQLIPISVDQLMSSEWAELEEDLEDG